MIKFENITKKYKERVIIKNLTFEIPAGKTVVLIGPSGCGKTTTLKMINRLIAPTSGRILINGKEIKKDRVVKMRRNIGYVIQQTGLFPHMTIKENIEIIPKLEKIPKEQIDKRTNELMEMTGLSKSFLYRYPPQLSGGQQQRVGVARAFALDPDVILMDEPFSALDPITRAQLQDELSIIQQQVQKTIVFVTHDMEEAIKIADLICVMNKGQIEQYDTPENILKNPASEFVTQFIGKNRIWQSPEYIKAEDIMEDALTTAPHTSIFRAREKMRNRHMDFICVTDKESKLLGVANHRIILRYDNHNDPISSIMLLNPRTVAGHESIAEILKIMNESKITTIPVTDENSVLKGVVNNASIVMVLSKQFLDEEEAI